jgi:hypothetical protein
MNLKVTKRERRIRRNSCKIMNKMHMNHPLSVLNSIMKKVLLKIKAQSKNRVQSKNKVQPKRKMFNNKKNKVALRNN